MRTRTRIIAIAMAVCLALSCVINCSAQTGDYRNQQSAKQIEAKYLRIEQATHQEAPSENEGASPYSEGELYELSHLIYGEAGCDWIPNWVQLYVGSVVLNRVQSELYSDNIHDVIFQSGQYACTTDGNYAKTPDERTIENARTLLMYGSVLPQDVLGQSSYTFGYEVFCEYYDEKLHTTTYFFYLK